MTDDFWADENWDSRATPVNAPTMPVSRVSGRWMVASLIGFGVLTTTAMWVYWTMHVGPFRPMQDAIAAAFPHSSPRVEGGQHKMHKGTPKILRVVMRVDFDPERESGRGEEVVNVVQQIASKYVDLGAYEELEVFLYQGVPEKDVRQQEFKRALHGTAASTKTEKSS